MSLFRRLDDLDARTVNRPGARRGFEVAAVALCCLLALSALIDAVEGDWVWAVLSAAVVAIFVVARRRERDRGHS